MSWSPLPSFCAPISENAPVPAFFHDSDAPITTSLQYSRVSRGSHVVHRQLRSSEHSTRMGWSSSRCPRPSVLGHVIAAVWIAIFLVHIISCGLFFCVTIPMGRSRTIDIYPDAIFSSQQSQVSDLDGLPKLIPRIIHQTYKSRRIPEKARSVVRSWMLNNNKWQYRFYDDSTCLEFVSKEFPEYLDAYQSLPKDVERSDFFRYMVVLRMGGVYADIDVECRQPLDTVIRPSDTMIVGWESEVSTDVEAFKRHFTRKRQVLQWFFAAAPGHPALRAICDHINDNAWRTFSNNTNRDTLERTGPGIWTDIILKHAAKHPVSQHDDPWRIRVLPRVAFGVHPAGIDNLTPDAKEIVALHHFLGSWKVRGGWQKQSWLWKKLLHRLGTMFPWLRVTSTDAPEEPIKDSGLRHFPVSTAFEPPFTMMVDLVGHGDTQAGKDVSAVITSWGTWQAALSPTRKPSVVDSLVGSLKVRQRAAALVDVGAGQGFFSLAAAARNHKVVAFERSRASVAALDAAARYNGFQGLIQLHKVPLGAKAETICVQRKGLEGLEDANDVNVRRGYGPLEVHSHNLSDCQAVARRRTLSEMLGNDTSVGAMRISANGWEGWVLEGAWDYLQLHKPEVLMVEMYPHLMVKTNYTNPLSMLQRLYSIGYSRMAHSGYVCDERWANITSSLRARGSFSADAQEALKQPTWCKLQPAHFPLLVHHAHEEVPENVLLLYTAPTPILAAATALSASALTAPLQEGKGSPAFVLRSPVNGSRVQL